MKTKDGRTPIKPRHGLSDKMKVFHMHSNCTKNDKGCLLFAGSKTTGGYAHVVHNRKQHMAHRFIFEHYSDIKPTRWQIVMHLCDEPSCINPDHLKLGTQKENAEDMIRKGRSAAQKRTKCVRGHDFDRTHTQGPYIIRTCRQCMTLLQKQRREREAHEKNDQQNTSRNSEV